MIELSPEAVSVSQMAQLLQLSRSRLYQLINENVLLPPVYLLSNRRPFYNQKMIHKNLEVKRSNIGINGQVIIFYSKGFSFRQKITKPKIKAENNKYKQLIEELGCLGLENISADQIESAILELFPDGTGEVGKDEMLRSVFRYLKRRNTEHKQRT
jgi:hypothetical protein